MGMTLEQAEQTIEQLCKQGALEEATFRCAADIIRRCAEGSSSCQEEFLPIDTADALAVWRREDLARWQDHHDADAFAEHFGVGHGRSYGCIEQMFSCTDYEFVFDLLQQILMT